MKERNRKKRNLRTEGRISYLRLFHHTFTCFGYIGLAVASLYIPGANSFSSTASCVPPLRLYPKTFGQSFPKHSAVALILSSSSSSISSAQRLTGRSSPTLVKSMAVTTEQSIQPPNHSKSYFLTSGLLAVSAIVLLFHFPQLLHIQDATASTFSLIKLSIQQRHQLGLATQWGAASGFGIASVLFAWLGSSMKVDNGRSVHDENLVVVQDDDEDLLQKRQTSKYFPTRLVHKIHISVALFCALGLLAIPGEFGMMFLSLYQQNNSSNDGLSTVLSSASSSPLLVSPTYQKCSNLTAAISLLGITCSTLGKLIGLWTSFNGLRQLTKNEHLSSTSSSEREDLTLGNEHNVVDTTTTTTTQGSFHSRRKLLTNVFCISKIDRKQAGFYRNMLLVVLGCIGSNVMETLFRFRYRTALAKSISTLDISMNLSSITRLSLFATLLYILKVEAENLPTLLYEAPKTISERKVAFQEAIHRHEGQQSESNQRKHRNANNSEEILIPSMDAPMRNRVRLVSKLNGLLVIWPSMVYLGNCATWFLQRGTSWNLCRSMSPQYAILAGMFALKGYRFYLAARRAPMISK